jgi:glycosyltransferase involved in cell wall biosynthesis
MRVLFWSEFFWPYVGGIEVWSGRLLPALMNRGYEFAVVTSHGSLDLPNAALYEGIPIFRFPFWTALTERKIDQLRELPRQVADLTRRFQPDLIHMNLTGPIVYFYLQTAEAHQAPVLVSYHHPLPSQGGATDTLVGRIMRSADWVNCFAAIVLDGLRQLVPEITPHSSVIYHGMDPPALAPAPLPFDPPRLLCLGRLVPEKGFDVALEAFGAIAPQHPNARLVIASNGPTRPGLEEQAIRLGLSDRVDFLGWVPFEDIPALLNSSTIVLMPSRYPEGFGLVALEAALMARPVVATRVGALQEVVVDGETGLLVEREDSKALTEAITHLLDHPDAAITIGQRARSRAQELFEWGHHVDAFDDLYRRLMEQKEPRRFQDVRRTASFRS